jgi:nuclear control of ATPase protein 2
MNTEFLYTALKELDAIFKLKDIESFQLKALLRPLGSESLDLGQVELIWKLLVQEGQPMLSKLNEIPPTMAHLLILFKTAMVIKADAMKSLLDAVPKVTNEIQYWEDRRSSTWSVLWYLLQLLPQNAPVLSRLPGVSKRVSFKESKNWIDNLKEIGSNSPFRIGLKYIRRHIHYLKRMNHVQAHCLGLMATPSYLSRFRSSSTDINEAGTLPREVDILYHPSTPSDQFLSANERILDQLQELVNAEICNLETILGSLSDYEMITGSPTPNMEISEFIPRSVQSLERISQLVQIQHFKFEKHFARHARPTFFLRYWPQIAGGLFFMMYSYRIFTITSVVQYTRKVVINVVDTFSSFVKEWLIRPVQDMLNTIRHKDSSLKIMGHNSLSSDLDSLERMVIQFASEHTPEVNVAEISSQIRSGDLTTVLQEYEKEIQTPLKSFVKGNLIRSLLIQIQKVKVDGGFALNALDKLLKSNELNFAFLAVMPTLFVTYGTVSWIRTKMGNHKGFGFSQKMEEIRFCLR